MNRFEWTNASTLQEAVAQVNSTVADATVAVAATKKTKPQITRRSSKQAVSIYLIC